jgi:Family of unknown function (DUF6011)
MSDPVRVPKLHLKAFILGGNSKFIVEDDVTKERHVVTMYKNRYTGDTYSTTLDSHWLGYFKPSLGTFTSTNGTSPHRTKFQEFIDLVLHDMLPDTTVVYHHGKCGACGRDLTDPLSMYIGIGPTCRKRMRSQYPHLPK